MSYNTKRLLANACKELMTWSTLDQVTVVDITKKSNVNRQTFYYHFKDVLDLVEWICADEAFNSILKNHTYEKWQVSYLRIFEYLLDNKSFILNCTKSSQKQYFEKYLFQLLLKLITNTMDELVSEKELSEKNKKYIANFYGYAAKGILLTWINDGMKEDPVEIIDQLNILISGSMKKAIDRYVS